MRYGQAVIVILRALFTVVTRKDMPLLDPKYLGPVVEGLLRKIKFKGLDCWRCIEIIERISMAAEDVAALWVAADLDEWRRRQAEKVGQGAGQVEGTGQVEGAGQVQAESGSIL